MIGHDHAKSPVTFREIRTLIARDRTPRASPAPIGADLLENACPAILGSLLVSGYGYEQATVILSALLAGVPYHLDWAGQPFEANRVLNIMQLRTQSTTDSLRLASLAAADMIRADSD